MTSISKTKLTIPALIVTGIFAITLLSYYPINVSAEYDQSAIPEISGSLPITEYSTDYTDVAKVTLSSAMSVSENSIENGKAMWGKLDVVQGYLVYWIGILSDDDVFHKIIVDAGTGDILYISDGVSKDKWKNSHHSDKKWKDHYSDLTPEERQIKKQQWGEIKDAFFSLSIDERAKMIMHFMSMKIQWESLSDEEKATKKAEMKSMMEDLLPLSIEEKTKKLREFVNSL